MSDTHFDYLKFAHDLLTRAAQFDQADHDQAVDDGDEPRTEVLKYFTEQWLEEKIRGESAAEINRFTTHTGNIDAEDIAPLLARTLGPKS